MSVKTVPYTIIKKPPMQIVGISVRTSNADPREIPLLWQRFFSENIMESIPNKKSNNAYGLYTEYEVDHNTPYTLIIGCEVNSIKNLPSGFVSKHLPASEYAVYKVTGDFPQSSISTWHLIWNTDLPRTYVGDLEVYGPEFLSHKSTDMEICIAIKK